MSGDIVSDSSATYAVLDLSKKKKVRVPEEIQESDSALPLYAMVEKTITKPEKKDNSVPAGMSVDIVSDSSATYAVVDFAKKKKNKKICVPEVQESESAISLCTMVEKTKTSITTPEKTLEYGHDSIDLANNYEVPVPSTSYLSVALSQQDKDKFKSEDNARARSIVAWVLIVIALVLVGAVAACLVFTFVEVSAIKSEIKSLQQLPQQINMTSMNRSDAFSTILKMLQDKLEKQENNSQELIQNLENSGLFIVFPAASCATILLFAPSPSSGYYWVRSSTGSAIRVYCDMTRSCGNITGGWMRVAELDMTDITTHCPSNLMLRNMNVRTCIQKTSEGACTSVYYPTNTRYSHVCGMIKIYPVGTPDAFQKHGIERPSPPTNISTNYVDGVSVTHGMNFRHHIWTYALDGYRCCEMNRPTFVANDFFCGGKGCMMQNNPPWFYKQLPQSSYDDIEMRLCRDQIRSNEDIAIETVEFYIQ